MEKKKKILFGTLFILSIISWTVVVNELAYNILAAEPNYKEEAVNFLTTSLWDQEYSSFYSYRAANGSFTDRGLRKYTSFNIWTVRSLLKYSISSNDNSTFDNYGLKALDFLLTYMQNKTNKGFYHWVHRNGSIPDIGDPLFNDSVYQIATYQAWVLITLIEIYRHTNNNTYIDVWGKELADFLIYQLWDSTYGGFFSSYLPGYDMYLETYKYTWYQAWPALALMNYYEITGNETYMNYVNSTLDFMTAYLWNDTLNAFVYYCLENGTAKPTRITLTDQAAAILAFSKAAAITGNQTYWDEYVIPLLNFTEEYLWDDEFKQFQAGFVINGLEMDPTVRPSDLSIWLFAFLEAIETLNDTNSLNNFLIPSLTHMNSNGWDYTSNGFFRKFFINGTLIGLDKWTIEQVLPLFFFSHYFQESSVNFTVFNIFLGIFIGTVVAIIYIFFKFKKTGK